MKGVQMIKINKKEKEKAFNLGCKAFINQLPRIPANDIKFLSDVIADKKVGEGSVELMQAWYKGWDYENLRS